MARVVLIALSLLAIVSIARAADQPPPPELLHLEREVSLKMAHARDLGFTEPDRLKLLSQANAVDAEAEKALKVGDYHKAEDDFLKAKLLLHDLGI